MKIRGTMVSLTGRVDQGTVSMAVPIRRQTRTNLLIPPPVSRVHRGINALPVVVEMPLWGIDGMLLVCELP
jgi:hypothetical protein